MKEMDINMEEKRNVNKNLLVIFRWTLKLIPMVLAGLQAINTIISYFGIHIKAFAHCFVFCLIGFIYIASYLLKFCEYHRMFLHYIVIIYIINCIDYYIGIPISDFQLLMLHSIITGISLFIILFLYLKIKRK